MCVENAAIHKYGATMFHCLAPSHTQLMPCCQGQSSHTATTRVLVSYRCGWHGSHQHPVSLASLGTLVSSVAAGSSPDLQVGVLALRKVFFPGTKTFGNISVAPPDSMPLLQIDPFSAAGRSGLSTTLALITSKSSWPVRIFEQGELPIPLSSILLMVRL